MNETVKISHCRSCGAAVIWAETKAGKLCPYDVVQDPHAGAVPGASHFGTCPQAKTWTKRKAGGHRQ